MRPGTDVRERVTGRIGVVLEDGRTFFPSLLVGPLRNDDRRLPGDLRLDGTYDLAVRDVPHRLLKELPKAQVMEAIADVLQKEG